MKDLGLPLGVAMADEKVGDKNSETRLAVGQTLYVSQMNEDPPVLRAPPALDAKSA